MRLREIDFLRGTAVVLVMFNHHDFFAPLKQAGWIGVDLFFVLSGFLVSGLLFKEYKKYGKINSKLFLIRRGFKIYPTFYFGIALTLLGNYFLLNKSPYYYSLLSELVFVQNYFGHMWNHTWSLAVEEHFYFGLTFFVYLFIRFNKLENKSFFFYSCLFVFLSCLLLRIHNAVNIKFDVRTHLMPTHLRIDSLLFGVFLSYFHSFEKERFVLFFKKNSVWLRLVACVFILLPFLLPGRNIFIHTIGYTLIYLGFGIVLSLFIVDEKINDKLDKTFSSVVSNYIAMIGYYSYSIYLFHMFVKRYLFGVLHSMGYQLHFRIEFILFAIISIYTGIFLSKIIEFPMLNIREKYFSKRPADPIFKS